MEYNKNLSFIKKWTNCEFQSSGSLTYEFAEFYRDAKKEFKSQLPDFEFLNSTRGHFDFSFFVRNINTKKMAYISCDDVRFWPNDWHNSLLIRTATDENDYTGGTNNNTTIENIRNKALELTK